VPDPSAALADVRNQLVRLGQQIAEMRTEPGAAGNDAMNMVVAELREAVRFLAERLDGVARMVAQRGEELADTRGALGAIDAHVRSQAETIAVLTTGMQALPSYGERVSALQDNLTALQQRLGGIEGAFGPLGQRLGGIEQAVARPADGSVTERLAAIEGMLGPLSQRLGQALAEQSASLQALHGRVESVASGTQAALATPIQIDEAAVGALEPRLAALLSEVTALRQEVSSLKASAPTVDLSALQEQIAGLAAVSNTSAGGGGGPVFGGDADAALRSVEQRITEHVDDAILALAQTLLGRGQRVSAAVDIPLDAELVATGWPSVDEDEYDDEEVAADEDADGDDSDSAEEDEPEEVEVAQIDFSAPELAEEAAAAAGWTAPVPSYAEDPDQAERDAAYLAQTGGDAPFDQDAQWAAQPPGGDVHPDVVPARRRRWFR
jgi:hypothetical protein